MLFVMDSPAHDNLSVIDRIPAYTKSTLDRIYFIFLCPEFWNLVTNTLVMKNVRVVG